MASPTGVPEYIEIYSSAVRLLHMRSSGNRSFSVFTFMYGNIRLSLRNAEEGRQEEPEASASCMNTKSRSDGTEMARRR